MWSGSTVYVRSIPASDGSGDLLATRVRIVGAPQRSRVEVLAFDQLATAFNGGVAAAFVGAVDKPGILLLDTNGGLTPLLEDETEIAWANGDLLAGLIARPSATAFGENSFSWMKL